MGQKLSYDLNVEMLNIMGEEFDAKEIVEKFAQSVAGGKGTESAAKEIFGKYGVSLMKRTIELGEKYTDKTYENLKGAIKKAGYLTFPYIPQRFTEIAYLAIQSFPELDVVRNDQHRLTFKIDTCTIFNALKEKCGDGVASQMPCKHACSAALKTLYEDLNLKANVTMDASMVKDGYCRFTAENLAIKS